MRQNHSPRMHMVSRFESIWITQQPCVILTMVEEQKSDELTSVAKQLTEFCEERRLTVVAVHLPGVMNIKVDRESRAQSDASDWLLNRSVFKILTSIWPVKIDHFSYSGTPNCLHLFPGVHNRVRPR